MSQALIEGLKQLVRVAILAVIPVVIAGLQAGHVDLTLVYVSAAIAVLSALDKWLHKSGVQTPLDLNF